jgi:three-Cys-motif partner protein
MSAVKYDTIGYWSEVKLFIINEYAKAFANVLKDQRYIKHVAYIDGFAGAGAHVSRTTGELVEGSPALALSVTPPFSHYHFVEMNESRARHLRQQYARSDVTIYEGDSNDVLIREVFPKCRYDQYRRALCLLDPYELNPNWPVIETAGKMRSIEIFLNFMIMDANMNVLWNNVEAVDPEQARRMTTFWGDDSWHKAAYTAQRGLFGDILEKNSNEAVVAAYCQRLKTVAGFKYVPEPIPMRNTQGAVVYYLIFASHNATGNKIAEHVFSKYRGYGLR